MQIHIHQNLSPDGNANCCDNLTRKPQLMCLGEHNHEWF